jgi:hypothetical protein
MMRLADGTHPGTERIPDLSAVVLPGEPVQPRRAAELDAVIAERDRAITIVAGLERIITATGGYMRHEDQLVLWAARAMLAEVG